MSTSTIPAILGDLGSRLRHYREIAGFSREYVSVQIGRGAGAIRDWELGKRPPRLTLLAQLAHLYGVPVTELVGTELIDNNSVAPR